VTATAPPLSKASTPVTGLWTDSQTVSKLALFERGMQLYRRLGDVVSTRLSGLTTCCGSRCEQSEFVRSAKGFDGRASPDDNAAFAAVAFRDLDAHRGLEASWD
jgi:hypothetical protein